MPIWKAPAVASQPQVRLVSWRIIETELHERHFVGYSIDSHEGRVSSAIEAFDPVARRGVTRSGRVYHLLGEPAHNLDAMYVWQLWSQIHGVLSARDVTDEVIRHDS